jgi:glycine cleavage system H lipoate-binding protein
MSAGLVTYKICDREFDCDRCPLDAGLREGTLVGSHAADRTAVGKTGMFPDDRRYSNGHTWLKTAGPDVAWQRFGVDAFAAAIIGHCGGVSWQVSPRTIAREAALCQLDLGLPFSRNSGNGLSVRAPLSGIVVQGNPSLRREPGLLVTAPYEDGWILEFQLLDAAGLGGLMAAEVARKKAQMDLQRFRRRIAVQLFTDQQTVGQCAADGGEPLADLRQMLGGPFYLDLLHEMIY